MSDKQAILIPTSPGMWKHIDTGDILEIYELEPVNDTLCIWGPDYGICYTGAKDTQGIWSSDEWQGHIPIVRYLEVNYPNDKLGWVNITQ